METLESYRERYRPVASLAGMSREFDAGGPLEIVEDKVGRVRPTLGHLLLALGDRAGNDE